MVSSDAPSFGATGSAVHGCDHPAPKEMNVLEPAERYTGYTAYDYLEKGVDYREFAYAKQIGRVPEYQGLDLSESQAARAKKLLAEETVISLHEHVQVFPEDMGQLRDHIRQGREPTAYEGLSRSGLTAVFDN